MWTACQHMVITTHMVMVMLKLYASSFKPTWIYS